MSIHNIEIKAHCHNPDAIRDILQKHDADYIGTDHQVDIYFQVPQGRLKLRKGTIEQKLIFYQRNNQKGPKSSDIHLVPAEHPEKIQTLLESALGTKVTVDKQREIYFIGNVKFHIDKVKKLGSFMEIEAIDKDGTIGEEKLQQQCQKYMDLFSIQEEDLVAESSSDLLLKR